ncbi:hypothetical protein SCMU_19260 [Sinomonas cyclohexanicum]|uniref:Uncharacterized protein n=2 Tax=Sinomonas cyclohexanicum TaxID=322009 RepID=A0ABN6FHE3_SINCY|nr:hypothetical protein SCMU_19260 [Corynebacterium cyclohexanicum]
MATWAVLHGATTRDAFPGDHLTMSIGFSPGEELPPTPQLEDWLLDQTLDPTTKDRIRDGIENLDAVASKPVTRRRDRVTDAKLLEVASVYREAMDQGKGPTRAVMEHFQTSYSTAARWVGMARKVKGGLGPSLGKFKEGESK